MMVCPHCNSTANPEGTKYCLECGAPLSHTAPASPPPPQPVNMPMAPGTYPLSQQPVELKTSGMAIASLICGIVSPCTMCITGLAGIVLGIVALSQINRPRSGLKGSGLAIAGIIVSICVPLLTAAVAYPVFVRAREVATDIGKIGVDVGVCMNNERLLVQAAKMYAQDHQETLPTGEEFWALPFSPPDIVYCPTKGKGAIGYGYYQTAAGQPLSSYTDPSLVQLFVDGGNAGHMIALDADIDRRHMGGYNMAYLDGRVETLNMNPASMPGMPPPSEGQRYPWEE